MGQVDKVYQSLGDVLESFKHCGFKVTDGESHGSVVITSEACELKLRLSESWLSLNFYMFDKDHQPREFYFIDTDNYNLAAKKNAQFGKEILGEIKSFLEKLLQGEVLYGVERGKTYLLICNDSSEGTLVCKGRLLLTRKRVKGSKYDRLRSQLKPLVSCEE